jgi:hypothetical protein
MSLCAQEEWIIKANNIDPNYGGVTVANGMIGIVCSGTFKVKDVVLAGAYINTAGRVSTSRAASIS